MPSTSGGRPPRRARANRRAGSCRGLADRRARRCVASWWRPARRPAASAKRRHRGTTAGIWKDQVAVTTRSRPLSLARYSAWSARLNIRAASSSLFLSNWTQPMLTVTWPTVSKSCSAMACRTLFARMAACSRVVLGVRMTNSSPPVRYRESVWRICPATSRTISMSTRSPTSCPWVSLIS